MPNGTDNIDLPGEGSTVATDYVAGRGHVQFVKLDVGGDGLSSPFTDPATGAKQDAQSATLAGVLAALGPLATQTTLADILTALAAQSTASKQDTGNTTLTAIQGAINTLSGNNSPRTEWRTEFSKAYAAQWDPLYWTTLASETGVSTSQAGGKGTVLLGTAANDEVIFRSLQSFTNSIRATWLLQLSQRITNQQVFVELVDVIGDNLAFTVNGTTSVSVTLPDGHPFDGVGDTNAGQQLNIGIIGGALAGTAIPQRATIADVTGNVVTLTLGTAWPAGTIGGVGTCSLFGWNYHRLEYSGVNAAISQYDAGCNGYGSGNTAATTVSTATAPNGHEGFLMHDDGCGSFADQNPGTAGSGAVNVRAARNLGIPYPATPLYMQVRVLNGSVAPASNTTLTLQRVSVASYVPQPMVPENLRPNSQQGNFAVTVGNTLTAVTQATINNIIADLTVNVLSANNTSATITPGNTALAQEFNVIVTAVTGAPILDVVVQESDDTGTNWFDVYHFPRITAVGQYRSPSIPLTGNRIRYVRSFNGTGSITNTVNRIQSQMPCPLQRQFYDRTININSINSTTPVWFVDGCATLKAFGFINSIGTGAPVLAFEVSDNNADWFQLGADITPTANALFVVTASDAIWRFARIRVKTAGVGAGLTYLGFKGVGR